MIGKLTLAEVDQLIDVLDRTTGDDLRPAFDPLRHEYARARRLRDAQLRLSRVLLLVVTLYYAVQLYAVDWVMDAVELTSLIPLWLVLVLNGILAIITSSVFPILRREDRVTALLRAYGADIPDEYSDGEDHLPPHVAVALETLENANSPRGLRSAYEAVEDWQFSAKGWTWNGIESALVWCIALVAATFGDQLGLPDFFRGAAFMFVVMMGWLYIKRLMRRGSIARRVEEALGRWRHLVPAMEAAQ